MGFFKDLAFELNKKWDIARYYYGDDIARELYRLPNSEPLSLMTEEEKAALKVAQLVDKSYILQDKSLTRLGEAEKSQLRDASNMTDILNDSVVSRSGLKEPVSPGYEWIRERAQIKSEIARQKWQHRLDLFKATGRVEKKK